MKTQPFRIGLLAAIVAGAAGTLPARPDTRLERCGADTCLRVFGTRPDLAATVAIAGHEVAVSGRRHWRASLPVDQIGRWLPAAARTVGVRIAGGGEQAVPLPIGLLGHATELALLDVGAPR